MANPTAVASIQFEPWQFDKTGNIDRLERLVEEAAREGARLIVTPEMATTGYCWQSREEIAPYVEPIPGATTERFARLARRYGCYIVLGMPEVELADALYYNTAVLIGPEGVVGKHRKTHPYIAEPKWAASGNLGHQVYSTSIGTIALLICMDIHFVETARVVGLAGATVICHISNWLAERAPAPYWINRAWENGCYLIESNRWGLERGVQFSGGSCIIDPDGRLQALRDTGDGIVRGHIDPQRVILAQRAIHKARRPALYKTLASQAFTWNPLDFFNLYGLSPLPPGQRSKVAVGQFEVSSDVAQNVRSITEQTLQAVRAGAQLIVFPELSLSGPFLGGDSALRLDDEVVLQLMRLALMQQVYIVVGLVEAGEEGTFYNSALLVGPEGCLGCYRKLHLNTDEARGTGTADDSAGWASAGDAWVHADLPIGRVGLLLGDDLLLPEAARVLALAGCDLVACPAALSGPAPVAHPGTLVPLVAPIPTGADLYHWHPGRVRAGENNLYLLFSNSCDIRQGHFGASGVFGPETFRFPRQERLITANVGVAVADIDTSNLDTPYPTNPVRRKDLLAMRLPHLYGALWQTTSAED